MMQAYDKEDDGCGWVELVHRMCFEHYYSSDEMKWFLFGFQTLSTPNEFCLVCERTFEAVSRRGEDEGKVAVECIVEFFTTWLMCEAFRDLDGHLLPPIASILDLCITIGPYAQTSSASENDPGARHLVLRNIQVSPNSHFHIPHLLTTLNHDL
jgi:hypothetical protein